MIEGENETSLKTSKVPDRFDFNDLIAKVLVREPLLLYFVCRRGSWAHQNNRGEKHPPLDPRGIINDREVDCKYLAKLRYNSNKKYSQLVRSKARKNWKKSMHVMPAVYCKLTPLGKKLYLYLRSKGMAQYIENNYSIEHSHDFVDKFIVTFNLDLPKDDEIENINNNRRKRIDSHRQGRKDNILVRNSYCRENKPNEQPGEINNSSLNNPSGNSRFFYNEIIETYKFSDNYVLMLLIEKSQTIRDIVYKGRLTDIE